MRKCVALVLLSLALSASGQQVTDTIPVWSQNRVGLTSNIVASYSSGVRGTTVTARTFFLDGAQSGRRTGTFAFNSATNQVTLTPGTALRPGEWMTAHLARGIQNTGGGTTVPFQWSWHNAAEGDAGKAQTLFRSRTEGFGVGGASSRSVSLGDMDGDGDLDAVSANSMWLNDGNGGFTKKTGAGFSTGYGHQLGDLNGNGSLDLVVDGAVEAYVFTNNGSGSLTLHELVQVQTNTMNGLSLTDFNGDGTLDLWLGVVKSGELYTNNGQAHFSLSQVISAPDTYDGQACILTDVNGDGSSDLWKDAPFSMTDWDRIFTNNGDGVLSLAWDVYGPLTGRADLKPGDFNNDGSVDVLHTRNGNTSMIICTNDGHGRFGKMYETQPFSTDVILDSEVGDFDGDGDLDVVCLKGDGTDGCVYTLKNSGTDFAVSCTNQLGVTLSCLRVGDLDGDGTLDVVAVPSSGTSIVLLNTHPQWDVFDAAGHLLSNGAAPQVVYGTEFGIVPAGSAITNSFRLANTGIVDFVFTSTLTTTNGAGTYQFNQIITNNAMEGLGGSLNFKLVFNPLGEGDHWGRMRIRDNANQTFDIILHGTSPGFIVTNTQPKNAAPGAAPGSSVAVQFSGRVMASTVTSNRFVVWGNQSGLHRGNLSFNSATNQITLDPVNDFRCGETLMATLTDEITSEAGHPMIPYAWSFRTAITNASCAALFADIGQRAGTNDARGAAFGDLNGDGWLDLFVANYGYGSEVWLNNGAGELVNSEQRIGTNLNSTSVALGDLDLDGDLDAILTSWQQTNTVWMNNGSGVFTLNQTLPLTSRGRKVVLADFNEDAFLDAFILNDGETNMVWGNYEGTFGAQLSRPGCHAGRDAAAGDLNGDGWADLLIVNADSSSDVWTNNGAGAFSVSTNVHPAGGVSAALGDLDNDNDLDIVIGCTNGPAVTYRNDGHGGFGSTFANNITGFCGVVQLGCLDGDNDLELMRLRDDEGVSSVWLNHGGGVLLEGTVQPLGVIPTPKGAEFGDLDNDGDLDTVLALGTNGVRLLINTRAGMHILGTNGEAIASAATPSVTNGTDFGTLTGGSLTNWFVMTNTSPVNMTVDGITTNGTMTSQFQLINQPSLIAAWSSVCFGVEFRPVAIATQSAVFTFSGSWTGGIFQLSVQGVFLPPLAVTNTTPRNAERAVAHASAVTAQFNLPVAPSTVTTNSFRLWSAFRGSLDGTVSVGGGNVSATFTPATNFMPGETVFAELNSGVRDADDLYSLPPKVWSFIVEAPKGSGLFTRRVLSPLPGNPQPSDMALGDLDGDGDLDAAVATDAYVPTNGFMKILLNDGAANFTTNGQVFSCGYLDTEGTALGDLDNDGDPDIVVGQYNEDTYPEVLWNNGSAQFTMETNVFPQTAQAWPAIGDLDGDGDLDVLFCGEVRADTVWFGNGAGHFTASEQQLGLNLTSPELADLDGDGDLDAVAYNYDGANGHLYVLLNNGLGVFATGSILSFPISSTRYGPCQIALGDLDADGDADIAFRGEELACRLWLNNGQASFTDSAFPSPAQSYGFAMGDLNADRALDFLIGTWSYSAPYPVLNDGHADFSYGPISSGAIDVVLIALGDLDGNGTLDALSSGTGSVVPEVLLNTAPVYLTVSAGAHGNIAPSGAVPVLPGASTSFLVTADSYYWVDSLLTNGAGDAAAAHTRVYTSLWNSVTADGTVSVSFAEALAAHGTPEWWLAQYGWTNDFDAAETNDTDTDDFPAWQEQIAGTDPTNGASFFQCLEISSENLPTLGKILRWNAISGRVYAIDGNTNLLHPWFELATNLPPTGIWTDTVHGSDAFINYRLGVQRRAE